MLNHINSVKRESLSGDNPYKLMKDFLPKEMIDLFDVKEINQNEIILKKKYKGGEICYLRGSKGKRV